MNEYSAGSEPAAGATAVEESLRRLLAGLMLLAVAGLGWWVMEGDWQAFTTFVMRGDPGPFMLPQILLAAVATTGLWLVVLSGVQLAKHKRAAPGPRRRRVPRREALVQALLPAGFLASVGSMPLLMQTIGSLAAMALFAVTWIAFLGLRAAGPSLAVAATALVFGVGAALFTQGLFVRLLNVPLPQ